MMIIMLMLVETLLNYCSFSCSSLRYVILSREIFNPNYGLFIESEDAPTYQPNPLSSVNTEHLSYFKFVGRIIGKAIADNQVLDAFFTRSFYKHLLGVPVSWQDVQAIDPEVRGLGMMAFITATSAPSACTLPMLIGLVSF